AKRYQGAAEVKRDLELLLKDAGIDDPLRDLSEFIKSPEKHGADVKKRVVRRNLENGEDQLRRGKTSAALVAFGRARALDPDNAQARGRVERIRRRERLLRYGRRAAIALAGAAALYVVGLEVRAVVLAARARAAAARAAEEKRAAADRARAEAEAAEK